MANVTLRRPALEATMDEPAIRTEIIPYIFYRDVVAALAWLAQAFGLSEELREATPSGGMHAQMTLDGQRVMMGQGGEEWRMLSPRMAGAATQGVFVYLADVEAHYQRAKAAGAEIADPPRTTPTAAATRPATSRVIPGSSPRRPAERALGAPGANASRG
jgi:PhnB protein